MVGEEGVLRTDEVGADLVTITGDAVDFAADALPGLLRPRGVIREHPRVPPQVGTHIADNSTPRSFSGGNVIGTRIMLLKMPRSPR